MALPKAYIPKQNGFTIIELLVVIGIVVLLFGLVSFFSFDIYRGYLFRGERDLAVSVLQKARSQSMANIDQQPHGVHLETAHRCLDGSNNCYVIFEGANSTAFPAKNIYVPFVSGAISHVLAADVVFNQLDGSITTPPPGGLHLSYLTTHDSVISFNNEGQITWTN